METKLHKILFLGFIFILFFASRQSAYGASGSISVVPSEGIYTAGSLVTAAIKIDGGGTAFNAAKATVSLVPNQPIQSITLGDCAFALIKTPSIGDPSFVGALLGSSSNSCTAYTIAFKAQTAGNQQIILSEGSIKAFHGATELLSTVRNASFTINGTSKTTAAASEISPTQPPIQNPEGDKVYNVTYSIVLPKGVSPSSVLATLDSKAPTQTNITQVSANEPAVLTATFEDVPEGVHTLSAFYNNNQLSEQIVNVNGTNKNLAFGNTAKQSSYGWILIVLLIIILLGIGVGGYFLYRRYRKNLIFSR